jgi:hypothetical protein
VCVDASEVSRLELCSGCRDRQRTIHGVQVGRLPGMRCEAPGRVVKDWVLVTNLFCVGVSGCAVVVH